MLVSYRAQIDIINNKLAKLLLHRFELVEKIKHIKDKEGLQIKDQKRVNKMHRDIEKIIRKASAAPRIRKIFKVIFSESLNHIKQLIIIILLSFLSSQAQAIKTCTDIIKSISQRNQYVEKLRVLYEKVQLGEFYLKSVMEKKDIELDKASKRLSEATLELNILRSRKSVPNYIAVEATLEWQIEYWVLETEKLSYFDLNHRLDLEKNRIEHAKWILSSQKADPRDKETARAELPEFEKQLALLLKRDTERRNNVETYEKSLSLTLSKYEQIKSEFPEMKEVWERPRLSKFFDNKGELLLTPAEYPEPLFDSSGKQIKALNKKNVTLQKKLTLLKADGLKNVLKELQRVIILLNRATFDIQKIGDPAHLTGKINLSPQERHLLDLHKRRLQYEYERLLLEVELDTKVMIAKKELEIQILENEILLRRYESNLEAAHALEQKLIIEKGELEKKHVDIKALNNQVEEIKSTLEFLNTIK